MKRLKLITLREWLEEWYEEEITTSRLLELINDYFEAGDGK